MVILDDQLGLRNGVQHVAAKASRIAKDAWSQRLGAVRFATLANHALAALFAAPGVRVLFA